VQTEGGDLVTALVENADTLDLGTFLDTFQERIALARQGKDQASQHMPVVLTYVGGQSVMWGAPLVVSPAVATLFFCSPAPRKDEEPRGYVSLGFDHRVLNGMAVAHFLEGLSDRLAQEAAGGDTAAKRRPGKAATAKELRASLLGFIGEMLGIAPDEFESLGVLGLDSLRALKLKTFLDWTRCLANSSPPIIETRGTEHWYMTDVRESIKHLSNEQLRKLQASRPPATATRSTGRRSTTSAAPITRTPPGRSSRPGCSEIRGRTPASTPRT